MARTARPPGGSALRRIAVLLTAIAAAPSFASGTPSELRHRISDSRTHLPFEIGDGVLFQVPTAVLDRRWPPLSQSFDMRLSWPGLRSAEEDPVIAACVHRVDQSCPSLVSVKVTSGRSDPPQEILNDRYGLRFSTRADGSGWNAGERTILGDGHHASLSCRGQQALPASGVPLDGRCGVYVYLPDRVTMTLDFSAVLLPEWREITSAVIANVESYRVTRGWLRRTAARMFWFWFWIFGPILVLILVIMMRIVRAGRRPEP